MDYTPPEYQDKRITYNELEKMKNYLKDLGLPVDKMSDKKIIDEFQRDHEGDR